MSRIKAITPFDHYKVGSYSTYNSLTPELYAFAQTLTPRRVQSGWGGGMSESREIDPLAVAKLKKVLNQSSPGHSVALYSFVESLYFERSYYYDTSSNGSAVLYSFQFINEFLAQEEHQVYKDFLDANWDHLISKADKLEFGDHPHTSLVLKKMSSFSVLSHWSGQAKKEVEPLEALTKEQVLGLLNEFDEYAFRGQKNGSNRRFIAAYLATKTGGMKKTSSTEVRDLLGKAIANAYANDESDVNFSRLMVTANALNSIREISIVDKVQQVSNNSVLAGAIHPIAEALYRVSDRLTLKQIAAVIHSLSTRSSVVRTGSFTDYIDLILALVGSKTDDDEAMLSAFRLLSEIVLYINTKPLTLTEWKKALESDLINDDFDAGIFMSLAGKDDQEVRKSAATQDFRRSFTSP